MFNSVGIFDNSILLTTLNSSGFIIQVFIFVCLWKNFNSAYFLKSLA
jgi:hypothetical protein